MAQQKNSISPWLLIIFIIVLFGGLGYFVWFYYINNSKGTPIATTPTPVASASSNSADITANWKTFTLEMSKATIKHPQDWKIELDTTSNVTDSNYYFINKEAKASSGSISEFNLSEWIKGPPPNAGYVLPKEEREIALILMQEIYQKQKIDSDIVSKFQGLSNEFFPYTTEDMAGLKYIASEDNNSRGFAVIGTHGQDLGLATMYYVSLYNKQKNTIVTVRYPLETADSPEVKPLRDRIDAAMKISTDEAVRVDKEVHQEFIQLMSNVSRENLSFSPQMDKINQVGRSLTF